MEGAVKKTWKPVFAGILDLVSAVISLWFLLALSLEGAGFWAIFPKSIFGINNPSTVYLIIVIPLLCIAILTFIGGIYALKRRKWRLVLAGSIAAVFTWTPVALLVTPALIIGSIPLCILVLYS